jgi:hypothetical protein
MNPQPDALTLPRLRRRPVPVAEPYALRRPVVDDDPGVCATQGNLALALPYPHDGLDEDDVSPRPLPEPQAWVARFVQAAVEVAAGTRPPAQLARWATLEVSTMLARRAVLSARARRHTGQAPGRRAVVRSVRTCQPREGVCEASAVVMDGTRVRAVALRMECTGGRWRVIALELG